MNTIKLILMKIRTARMLRRLDREIFRLETIATNAARSIRATDRVLEAIESGDMS